MPLLFRIVNFPGCWFIEPMLPPSGASPGNGPAAIPSRGGALFFRSRSRDRASGRE
jgi:hypothetical protein